MLRSLIACVLFLFCTALISIFTAGAARAEMPFEGWLSLATQSLDQQMQLSRKSWSSVAQSAAGNFDYALDQCRLGVVGSRGLHFVRAIELLEQLRHSGLSGVLASTQNTSFTNEDFELPQQTLVPSERKVRQLRKLKAVSTMPAAVVEMFSAVLSQRTIISQWPGQAETAMIQLSEAVYRPTEPIIHAANRGWRGLMAMPAGPSHADVHKRADINNCTDNLGQLPLNKSLVDSREGLDAYWEFYSVCDRWEAPSFSGRQPQTSTRTRGAASAKFVAGKLLSCWREVSDSAEAKLNWLTSKVQHIAAACLRIIEPQFLILEFESLEAESLEAESQSFSQFSVAETSRSSI